MGLRQRVGGRGRDRGWWGRDRRWWGRDRGWWGNRGWWGRDRRWEGLDRESVERECGKRKVKKVRESPGERKNEERHDGKRSALEVCHIQLSHTEEGEAE